MMDHKVKTGIKGLDEILEGGFLSGCSVLLEGPPGSGKTNLGLQILYNGITRYDESGLLITFEQYPEQIYRDALSLGMDLKALQEQNRFGIIMTSPMKLRESFAGVGDITQEEIEDALMKIRPRRILIDSITHFSRITPDEIERREILMDFLHRMSQRKATCFFTKELESVSRERIEFEEYLVDASLRLHNHLPGRIGGTRRALEVRKTRGHGHLSGIHPMEFTPRGILVYPHRRPPEMGIPQSVPEHVDRVSSGVHGLDYLLHGGYVHGSSVLLAGTAGSGKTTFAMHFVKAALEANEPCLVVALNESPQRITEMLSRMKIDFAKAMADGILTIHYAQPVELCLDRLYDALLTHLEEKAIRRVVIDSISDFSTSIQDSNLIRDYVYTFVKLFESRGVTSLLTSEMEKITGSLGMSDINFAFVLDAVVYLGFCEIESQMRRVITILKLRGSDHESELRELILSPEGPRIGTKFTGLWGVTAGVPTGRYQATVDEMIQPLAFMRSFAQQLRSGTLSQDKQIKVLDKMVEQTDRMIDYLCENYGLDRNRIVEKEP